MKDELIKDGAVMEQLEKANAEFNTKSPDMDGTNANNILKFAKGAILGKDINPVDDRMVIRIKSWPGQYASGIFVPESSTVIRNELYVAEILKAGPEAKKIGVDSMILVSMYSGYHIHTKEDLVKIISETDILAFKKVTSMKAQPSFDPKTFKPGINNILVKVKINDMQVSDSGLVTGLGDIDPISKNDAPTQVAEVLAIGPQNEFGKKYKGVKKGSHIVIDSYVGIEIPKIDVKESVIYKIMLSTDVLGYVN